MDVVEEFRKDLAELHELEKLAKRSKVKALLLGDITQVEGLLARAQAASGDSAPVTKVPTTQPTPAQPPSTTIRNKLTNYAWDQSEKFVKIYVTFPGDKVQSDQVSVEFSAKNVHLLVQNFEGKDHEFIVEGFLQDIIPDKSYHKVKSDSILLMLKKSGEGLLWDAITKHEHIINMRKEESKQQAMGGADKPQHGLMKMMKQMYQDGDDDMKRTIKKAWLENAKTPGGII